MNLSIKNGKLKVTQRRDKSVNVIQRYRNGNGGLAIETAWLREKKNVLRVTSLAVRGGSCEFEKKSKKVPWRRRKVGG